MPVLNANTTIRLGPYQRGAKLEITHPASDRIANFPQLTKVGGSSVDIAISKIPKSVTLSQGDTFDFQARAVDITYQII